MYTSFFGLNEKPFAITPDPRYLFMSERHGEGLAHLLYGVTDSGGFIQLTGEVGTGKTTLVRSLLGQLPEEVKDRWRERCGIPIYQVYGSTEAGHVTYSKIGIEPSPRAIGFPLKSRECMIVNPQTRQPVADGESGELWVTSVYTLKEYYQKPEETRKAFVKANGKTWCRMGDFVSREPTGELIYMERSADIIKHKAYRVSASEVEATLQDHPTVIGACVVGIPDPKVGERIKAIVVLKEDARGVGGTELIRFCQERLAAYKVPSYIEFRDMLPKSKVGKLLRREVRDDEARRATKDKKVV